MVPTFPHFKVVELEDQSTIRSFTRGFPPYSDFNFTNLFCYNADGGVRYSFLEGNLAIRMVDYLSGEPFYTFLGQQRTSATIDRLLALSVDEGLQPELRLLPSVSLGNYLTRLRRLMVREDRGGFDYVHSVRSLIGLNSPRLKPKRKRVEALKRHCPRLRVRELDLAESATGDEIRSLCQLWNEKKGRSEDEFATELAAIERGLDHWQQLELIAVGAYLDDQLVGFTVNEAIHDGYYMGHFGKADPDLPGCSELLEQETARLMRARGCQRLNNQQDLGLAGLRFYKRSWAPEMFLKKYLVSAAAAFDERASSECFSGARSNDCSHP